MNWEAVGAIGEVVGASGVIITLFYFGIQIRKSQLATIAAGISTSHQAALNVEAKLEENSELICKGNRGDPLSETEQYRINRLATMVGHDAFYKYLQSTTRNEVARVEVLAHNLASVLIDNPCLKEAWLLQEEVHVERRKGIDNFAVADDWVKAVKSALERLDA